VAPFRPNLRLRVTWVGRESLLQSSSTALLQNPSWIPRAAESLKPGARHPGARRPHLAPSPSPSASLNPARTQQLEPPLEGSPRRGAGPAPGAT